MLASSLLGTRRVFKHHVHVAYYWLALLDAVLFTGACYLGTFLYFLRDQALLDSHLETLLPRALVFAITTVLAMTSLGLYQPRLREGLNGILLRVAGSFVLVTIAMAATFWPLPPA